uniref:Protein kinase domain-containing protein n=1 Tax=Eutreptiella gymnastica TaxID=73025 RepID=A0A7S1INU7_9EUGL
MLEDAAQCEQLQAALRASEDARHQLELEVDRQKALVKQLQEALHHSQAAREALMSQLELLKEAQSAQHSNGRSIQLQTVSLAKFMEPEPVAPSPGLLADPSPPARTYRHDSHLLGSEQFTDGCILEQLMDERYQLPLSATNAQLAARGPDFSLLAAHLSRCPWESTEALHDRVQEGLAAQTAMLAPLNAHLQLHAAQMVRALVHAAETYLSRASHVAQDTSVPAVVLTGKCGTYRPTRLLGKGSAGVVYACEQLSVTPTAEQLDASVSADCLTESWVKEEGSSRSAKHATSQGRELVLKRVKESVVLSAEHEYNIGTQLSTWRGKKYIVPYLDRCYESPTKLWLVEQRVKPHAGKVDFVDYLKSGFFQDPAQQQHTRSLVRQLLKGLRHVAHQGVILRDVKPDNVLVCYHAQTGTFEAQWADYGLAVNVYNLRRPSAFQTGEDLFKDLLGWWYDTQKIVPRPKWKARRPPEQCYRLEAPTSAYDLYMLAILFCCMGTGIDIPHIDKESEKTKLEAVLGVSLPENYLEEFEMGSALELQMYSDAFLACFERTFGHHFGRNLFRWTKSMLHKCPSERPCIERIVESLFLD